MEPLILNGRPVGPAHAPYIIAEIGSNHNGDMELCRRLIDAAVACGADAVKFQSWSRQSLISRAEYQRNTVYTDRKRHFGSLEEMVRKYQFTPAQHAEIFEYCRGMQVEFLSSCFAPAEVGLLEEIGVSCHKIASMDVNHLPLLKTVAETHKPVLLSTGMATLGEVETALEVLDKNGAGPVALLHCVSVYPPDPDDIHLANMATLEKAFDRVVGFSDHTLGTAVPLAAVALGASIVEKHFTLDKQMEGWDHWISADPSEMRMIVDESRVVWRAVGSPVRRVSEEQMEKRRKMRRRIVLRHALPQGHVLTEEDLDYKRPGTGIGPDETRYVIGRPLRHDMDEESELEWTDLS